MADQQRGQATSNLVSAQDVDPDKAAAARTLAPLLGLPAVAMEDNPSFWQQQADLRVARGVMSTDQQLQKWLASDPGNAKVAQGDVPQLGLIGRLWNGFSEGFTQSMLEQRIGELGFSEQTGTASPRQINLLQTFKEQAAAQPKEKGTAAHIGGFLGGTAQMFANALPEAATGAAYGGVTGAFGGATAGGVGAIPGAIAGAIGGGVFGLTAGIAGQSAIETSGQTYDTLNDAKDKLGRPIPESTKQAASVLSGVVTGALALAGGKVLGAPAKALVAPFVRDVAVEAATRPTLARALGTFAKSAVKAGVTGALVNGGMTATQLIAPQVAEAVTSPDFETAANDPEMRQQLINQIVDSMEQGALAFPLMELPMRGVSLYADVVRARAAARSAGQWAQMSDAAGASKTRQRAPDAFSALMQMHASAGDVDSIYVPADRVAELYQGMQTRPGDAQDPFAFVPDMQEQMDQGLLTGGDVQIPTAQFVAHLAGTDIERNLRPDIRFAPDGFTLREALELQNHPPADLTGLTDEDAGDVGVDHRGAAIQAVKADITDQLRRAGFTPNVAEQYATLIAARYGARGDDFAQSPLDLYRQEGLQVLREDQPRVGPATYSGIDEAIDSLRRGDRQPSDRQLYGPSLLEYLTGGSSGQGMNRAHELSEGGRREAAGGIQDTGGDIAAMGGNDWHRGQPGRRKLINPEGMRIEEAAQRAHDAGYFPDHPDVPDINEFLSALQDELNGRQRYVPPEGEALKREQARAISEQLRQFLDERGINIKTATNAEIKRALDEAQQGGGVRREGIAERAGEPPAAGAQRPSAPQAPAATRAAPRVITLKDLKALNLTGGANEEVDGEGMAADFARIIREANERGETVTWREDGERPQVLHTDSAGRVRNDKGLPVGWMGALTHPTTRLEITPRDVTLNQPDGSFGMRGSITLGSGERIVRLFKGSDRSTFLHEMGHQFLDELLRDAMRDDAPDDLKADAATVRKWLGLKDGEMPGVDGHEKFATGFETYLMEGKAPSVELQTAFQKFAAWLTRIYRTIVAIGSPITPQIRGVMDRLLATDDAIAEAKRGLNLNPVFKTAEDAGMTKGEFAAYTAIIRKAQAQAHDQVLKRTMRTEALKDKLAWTAESDAVRPEIEQQVKSRPALQAWHLLAYGRDILDPDREVAATKLDLAATRNILGASFPRLPRGLTAKEGGIHPDALAPAFGYESGEAMLRDIVNENVGREDAAVQMGRALPLNKYIAALVDQGIDEQLEQLFGDPLTDGTVEETALAAAHNKGQRDVLAAEMRQLGKQAGQEPPYTVQQVTQWVRASLADTPIKHAINVAKYRKAEAQAGLETQRFLLARKPIDAFKAKQRQMIAHVFATEAERLQKDWQITTTYWLNVAKAATRSGTAQPFVDQTHGILERLGINVRRDPGELSRALAGKPLADFQDEQNRLGVDLVIADFLRDQAFRQHYQTLTSDQFQAARDAVNSLLYVGRRQNWADVDGRRVALNELADQIADSTAMLPNVVRPTAYITPGAVEGGMRAAKDLLANGLGGLRMVEHLLVQLDGGKPGPLHAALFAPMKRAAEVKRGFIELKNSLLKEALDAMPADYKATLKNLVEVPGLTDPKTGKNIVLTRDNLLALAMNIGNAGEDSNLEKLAAGFGWEPEAIIPALNEVMTKTDFDFVQRVGDLYERFRDPLDQMSREMTGVGLKFVEPTPFSTQFGDYRGWYFPIIYDRFENPDVFMKEDPSSPFGGSQYFRATTRSGSTIARTGYKGRLEFDLRNVATRIDQTLHDIAFRRAVSDAYKVLTHKRIRQTIIDKAGQHSYDYLNDWLRSVARSSNVDDKAVQGLNRVMRYFRSGLGSTYIAFNPITALLHGPTAFLHGMGEVGIKYWTGAARDLMGSLFSSGESQKFVQDNSYEVRTYTQHLGEQSAQNMRRLLAQDTLLAKARSKGEVLGDYALSKMLNMSAHVVFLARYRQAMDEGMTSAEAAAEGDRAVRFAHGGKDTMDQAALFRANNEFVRSMVQFGSFFNTMFNRSVDIVNTGARGVRSYRAGDVKDARRDFADVMGKAFTYWFLTSALGAGVRGYIQGQKPQDESWPAYYAEMFGLDMTSMVPELEQTASLMFGVHRSTVSGTPVTQAFEELGGAIRNMYHLAEGIPMSKRWLQNDIEAVGTFTHLPGGLVIGRAAQSVLDDLDGDVDPQGFTGFVRGLLFGPPKGS
jgi:hypothetical protein